MLILRRTQGQTICIGADVKVTVIRICRGEVRIGIDAPKSTTVHRQEVYERILLEGRSVKKSA
jgi:carbon storage regulator